MAGPSSDSDRRLCQTLCEQPRKFNNRYDSKAREHLLETLFRSLTNDRPEYLQQLFPRGIPHSYRLQDAQGVEDEAEYTAAARGTPCGHILKSGEASYHCSTCTNDPTAVLCARCFAASDHEGHQLHISLSSGNSGCCDCGDVEAWKRPVNCAIHTQPDDFISADEYVSALPEDLQTAIRITISRALDYFCDIISCSPENLRLQKTVDSVRQDETRSRLTAKSYLLDDEVERNPEYSLIIWNDEKHTVKEVQQQVARACRERESFGLRKADEANDIGRSVVRHSRDLQQLTRMAKIIEEIKITVTIRSSRDTFREQMAGTIIGWLADIAACSIAGDAHILRRIVCEEMLQLWRVGSEAWNAKVGRDNLDVHGIEQTIEDERRIRQRLSDPIQLILQRAMVAAMDDDDDMSDDENLLDQGEDEDDDDDLGEDDDQDLPFGLLRTVTFDANHPQDGMPEQIMEADATDDADEMDTDGDVDFLDVGERMDPEETSPPALPPNRTPAASTTPPPPPPRAADPPPAGDESANYMNIPRSTPTIPRPTSDAPPNHWLAATLGRAQNKQDLPVYEDLLRNIRIDSMILFDLRLWKVARTSLRDLYISTVVKIPQFKRILGLRFSGLYTTLAQLYLIADREPDHSIINLSIQILTTPSICQEVIEKGNFLTNLMAILYTFLTTRQVSLPRDVDPGATLAFDAGAVANRRLFHFFSDLKYFLASTFVQAQIRADHEYLFQYLDLVKLLQGICPNVRAVGEHVEYETDAWISAALLTREVNRLCRQFAETYQTLPSDPPAEIEVTYAAISHTAGVTMINALGLERKRFEQCEIKELVRFHVVGPFPMHENAPKSRVIDFAVERASLSFHHPLHYTLSWLLECGKESHKAIEALQNAAQNILQRLREAQLGPRDSAIKATITSAEDALLAMFDYPLRVCAWLAQMKANMWVRNGMSLRHQMGQYKSVPYRDVAHQRDLFLLQTALVTCDPSRLLVSMIDRFGLSEWMLGRFASLPDCEDSQMLDLVEDFIYLLINLLSDRDSLTSKRADPESQLSTVRKEIAHTLCFKPLSYSDLMARLTERVQDHEKLQEVLESMTKYRPPEGLHDSGLFELNEEFLHELDPYNSHFSKNQRDEAENIYKKWMGKKLNKDPDDVVLEPKLHTICSEAYQGLSAVVHTSAFADVTYRALSFVAYGYKTATGVSSTRVEAFLQIVLQLALVATLEDTSGDDDNSNPQSSFIHNSLSLELPDDQHGPSTVVRSLHKIWLADEFSSCRSKIRHVLRLFNQKRPREFVKATSNLDFPSGRFDTSSPANLESEIEARKKRASERKSKVMAQFQQQQQSFIDKQGMFDWDDEELTSPDAELPASTETRLWKFPAGLCIQCREDTSDSRLYGTFAMVTDGYILRETELSESSFVQEVLSTPNDLDRSIEHRRPFGVSGLNHEFVTQMHSDGHETIVRRQGLGKGWPRNCTMKGPLSTSCGHIMHFACFENYYQSVNRRHSQQVARNHPERVTLKEFVCPLCKALANTFLPIVWKGTEQSYPGTLGTRRSFAEFLDADVQALHKTRVVGAETINELAMRVHQRTLASFSNSSLTPAIELVEGSDFSLTPTSSAWAERPELAPFTELASIYLRLKEPLAIIAHTTRPKLHPAGQPMNHFQLLLDTLANTVAAVEIAHRGREAEYGTSLLSAIPQQTLSHLQTLSSTVRAFSATGAVTVRGAIDIQYRELYQITLRKLFGMSSVTEEEILQPASQSRDFAVPLLRMDSFQFFVHASMVVCPLNGMELRHMLHLSFVAELLRVLLSYTLNSNEFGRAKDTWANDTAPQPSSSEIYALETVMVWMERCLVSNGNNHQVKQVRTLRSSIGPNGVTALWKIIRSYALGFLRKAAVLFHVAHGVDLPVTAGSEASLPELDRLTHFLQLPSIAEMLMDYSEYTSNNALKGLSGAWVYDWFQYGDRDPENDHAFGPNTPALGIKLLHPAPLELVGLPKYFDVLIEESSKRRCPTTGKELSDPALCLFCGDIICSQSVCCMTADFRGGCNTHVDKCSSPIGMFLFVRKCHVVLLHVASDPKILESGTGNGNNNNNNNNSNSNNTTHPSERDRRRASTATASASTTLSIAPNPMTVSHGSFFPAPYLTKHGETDSGLRSKHQLILNQKRYDKLLRDTWLMVNGSVWSTVARKLEGEVNAGGWETL